MSMFGSPRTILVIASLVFACSSDDSDDAGGNAGTSSAGTSSAGSGNAGSGTGGSLNAGGTGGGLPAAVTFTNDVHPIMLAKCGASDCHDGEQAPLLPGHGAADVQEAYQATQGTSYTGELVYERILVRITDEEAMMPPDFANPPCEGEIGTPGCITEAELAVIEAWVEAGAPL